MMAKIPAIDVPVINLEVPALAELASRDQWVCWKYAPAKNGDGKLTKVPVQPSGLGASTTNDATWSSLNVAVQGAFAAGYGVGYVFNEDTVGIDLDGARNAKTGRAEPEAAEVLKKFKSYTEISPSGTGYHIFCKGRLPKSEGRKGGKVEIYTKARYFTMTGQMAPGSPETIEERQEAIDWFLAKFFPEKRPVSTVELTGIKRCEFPIEKFDALLTMDDKFRATWLHKRGDLKDQSLSTYDIALCVRAAMVDWADDELAALIYQHRVVKWGEEPARKATRQDYIDRTISFARSAHSQHSDGGEKVERAEAVAIARMTADDVAREGPEASLKELRTRLGIPVKRAIITGIDRALSYAMELEDGRTIEIGNTAALLDQRRFRCAVAETTKDVLPLVKQPVWDGTVKVFLAAAEHVDPGEEDPRQAMMEAIERYFEHEMPCDWDDEDAAEDVFMRGAPMTRGGAKMFTLRRFCRWLGGEGYEWKEADVKKLIKACGFSSDKPTKRIAGQVKARGFWTNRNTVIPT